MERTSEKKQRIADGCLIEMRKMAQMNERLQRNNELLLFMHWQCNNVPEQNHNGKWGAW